MAMASTLAFAETARPRAAAAPARQVALGSALLAMACVLGLVEASLPALPVAPWLRLGLANIAVVVAMAVSGARMATIVSLGRIGIVGLATGSLANPTFAMAAAGAGASLVVMGLTAALVTGSSPVGWSAAGSAAHVVAQLLVATLIVDSRSLLVIAAPSVLLALVLGSLTGYLARIA